MNRKKPSARLGVKISLVLLIRTAAVRVGCALFVLPAPVQAAQPDNLDLIMLGEFVRRQSASLFLTNNLLGSPITHQVGMTPQHYIGHAKVTQHYSDSSPYLSTVMLVSASASDSESSHSNSCDSYSSSSSPDSSSSSSSDSYSSCGGE